MVTVYTSQIGLADDIKKQLWEELDMVIHSVARSEKLFSGGDLIGSIGMRVDMCNTTCRCFGYGERNNGGVSILDIVIAYELVIAKEDHFVTFKSGIAKIQIDHFLIRTESRRLCKDCKVIASE